MSKSDLSGGTCVPCQGGMVAMSETEANAQLKMLDGWSLGTKSTVLRKRLEFKGFAKAVSAANAAAFLSDQTGHHADISFGWGYCEVQFTTHDAGGLTENDFICAAKFDAMFEARA